MKQLQMGLLDTPYASSKREGYQAVVREGGAIRSSSTILALFVLFLYGSWSVYDYQYRKLPSPIALELAGKEGFSEVEAVKHVKSLTGFGPHPVGSDALDYAMQYVRVTAEKIKNTSHSDIDVEVEHFHAQPGANRVSIFKGRTGTYADLDHIIVRISPKNAPEALENSILVSAHVDTVFSAEGAGDDSSNVATMLELARGISQSSQGFKNSVIFLFNTGEEEGLNGAHSFVTQHPWSGTIRLAVDLEAMGLGGKSGIFQADPSYVEKFGSAAKYPTGNVIGQELFGSGVINSATDFEVYKEAGLSGLNFAYTDQTHVYHTKNDKVELLNPGSLQHLGDNMLPFLLEAASSSDLPKDKASGTEGTLNDDSAIYFDILGTYMIVYRWKFANLLNNSVIVLSLLVWSATLSMGGLTTAISLALSCLSVVLMWVVSLSFSVLVAFILPSISSSAVPYIASQWIVIGLFGLPSLLGAMAGQYLGFLLLQKFLLQTYANRKGNLSPSVQMTLANLEAERWLFKSGTVQWLLLLIAASYFKLGSSYLPLLWLVVPAFAYGLLEATWSPLQLPKPLKPTTLLMAVSVPIVISAGAVLQLIYVLIGNTVRFDSNPGGSPAWKANVILAIVIAAVVCLMMVYLLSYVHLSGQLAKGLIIGASCALFGLSLAAIWSGAIPPFTEDASRPIHVVHVVDARESQGQRDPTTYLALFSSTPGNLTKEIEQVQEGFICGPDKLDFVTFFLEYGCWTHDDTGLGWSRSDIPTMRAVREHNMTGKRATDVSIDTNGATRWSLKINMEVVADFAFKVPGNSDFLVPMGEKDIVDGSHRVLFSGGKKSPTKFVLTLVWAQNSTRNSMQASENSDKKYLVQLRTDVDRLTPKAERVLKKLPWCSLFGEAVLPYTMAFFSALPINFHTSPQQI